MSQAYCSIRACSENFRTEDLAREYSIDFDDEDSSLVNCSKTITHTVWRVYLRHHIDRIRLLGHCEK